MQDFVDGSGGGQAFDDGNERHPRAVAFDDFTSDDIFQFVVVAFHQNIGPDFADQAYGCFDLIHGGHIEFLQQAKKQGDILILGINSDESVRAIKGDGRPIKSQGERANILSALQDVDYITIFNEETPESLIREIRPDVLVKGDDYKLEDVVGREIVEGYGARVALIPIVKGLSTSRTVDKILQCGPISCPHCRMSITSPSLMKRHPKA